MTELSNSKTLTPKAAAYLADAVYQVKSLATDATAKDIFLSIFSASQDAAGSINRDWYLEDAESASLAHGRSGAGMIMSRSGFAMVLKGREKGAFEKEFVVAIRGTAGFFDILSDLNATVTVTPIGLPVHAGFARIYTDIHLKIKEALVPGSRVHVIGHSLGGALANLLAADLARSNGAYTVNLYSFGAPRVGLLPFTSSLDNRRGIEAIYRVYDIADPVPMVPIFPFIHAPMMRDGYRIGASGGIMQPAKHRMVANYLKEVKDLEWLGLKTPEQPIYNYRNVDELLEAASIQVRIPGGSWGLWALSRVLQPLMEVASLVVGAGAFISETVVDWIARMLIRAAEISRRIGAQLLRFMELALKWAGKAAATGVEMTERFLRYLLTLLMTPILVAARKAVSVL